HVLFDRPIRQLERGVRILRLANQQVPEVLVMVEVEASKDASSSHPICLIARMHELGRVCVDPILIIYTLSCLLAQSRVSPSGLKIQPSLDSLVSCARARSTASWSFLWRSVLGGSSVMQAATRIPL